MSAAASHEALFAHRVHRAADAARVAELWPLDAHVQTETVPPSETPASDDGYRLPIGGNASADGAHMGQDPSPPRVSPKRARVVDAAAAAEDEEMPRAMAGSAGGRMAPGAGGAATAWETGGGGDAEGIAAGRRVRPRGGGGGGADDASSQGPPSGASSVTEDEENVEEQVVVEEELQQGAQASRGGSKAAPDHRCRSRRISYMGDTAAQVAESPRSECNGSPDFPASVAYELAPAHQCPPSLPAESARPPLLPRSSLRPPPPSSLPPTAVEAEAAAATALAPARYFPPPPPALPQPPTAYAPLALSPAPPPAPPPSDVEPPTAAELPTAAAPPPPQGPARFQAPAPRQVQRRVVQLEEQSIAQINGRLGLSNGNQPVVCADCISYSMRYGLAFSECRQTCPRRQRQQQASTQDSFWRTDLEMSQSSHPPSSQARHNFGSQSQQLHSNWVEDSQGF